MPTRLIFERLQQDVRLQAGQLPTGDRLRGLPRQLREVRSVGRRRAVRGVFSGLLVERRRVRGWSMSDEPVRVDERNRNDLQCLPH